MYGETTMLRLLSSIIDSVTDLEDAVLGRTVLREAVSKGRTHM